MKIKKASSLPNKILTKDTKLLGIEGSQMSLYNIPITTYFATNGINPEIKINTGKPASNEDIAILRINVYNHRQGINLILIAIRTNNEVERTYSEQLDKNGINVINFYNNTDKYVCFNITAPAYSDFVIEDLSQRKWPLTFM